MWKILLCAILALGLCLPADEQNNEIKPGYCYIDGIYLKEGEAVPAPIGKCQKMSCGHAEQNYIITSTCPTFKLREGCHMTQKDLTKPYPRCCPRPVCDSESDSVSVSASSEEF